MKIHHDIEQLRTLYLKGYNNALQEKVYKLPVYLEDWKETMNDIEFKLFCDIRSIGVHLYPYYPVEHLMVDFANPFSKVAILIVYKKTDSKQHQEKVDFLTKNGWKVYSMESKAVTFSAEQLYRRTNYNSSKQLSELEYESFLSFVNENSSNNSECLVYSIKEKYFKLEDANSEYIFR